MKLLLDANISWKLVSILNPVFGECVHVDSIGLTVLEIYGSLKLLQKS